MFYHWKSVFNANFPTVAKGLARVQSISTHRKSMLRSRNLTTTPTTRLTTLNEAEC